METRSYDVYMETHRRVLITGGSRGIGLGLAQRYLCLGARVIVTGRSAPALDEAAKAAPGLETVVSDVAEATARQELLDRIASQMPDLDLVVNNAGLQRRIGLASDHAPWSEREAEIQVLLSGPIHLNDLLIPVLLRHGRPATIVNVTSGGAFVPQPFAPVYSAAKAGLHNYTMNLRHALADTSVRVVELVPPAVATDLAGPGHHHGVPVDDFVDAAFAGIERGDTEVGYAATADLGVRLTWERDAFAASAGRFPVARYGEAPADA